MEAQELQDYVVRKYGLYFQTTGEKTLDLQELSVQDNLPFALLSIYDGELDVYCPNFAQIVRQRSQFIEPRLHNHPDWVGIKYQKVTVQDIGTILDYAFKVSSNGNDNCVAQRLVYLPGEAGANKYKAQAIPQKRGMPKRDRLPAPLQKMMATYNYTIFPAKEQAENFYRQGQMMADYEDNYDQIYEFQRYYPDYHAMNARQLRTYFTWRTQLRRGDFTVSSTSYAYVYIYELLNNIGVQDPEEGFDRLLEFEQRYASNYSHRMENYLHQWLQDYVLYYGLDREKANLVFADQLAMDRDYHILRHPEEYSPPEIIDTFMGRCTYLKKCRLYRQNPEEWTEVVACVWRRVIQSYPEAIEELIATRMAGTKYFFAGAVYYFHQSPKLTSYSIDSERRYLIQDRKYSVEGWLPLKDHSKQLNTFFHEVDRLARQKFNLGHPLKARELNQQLLLAIDNGLDDYQKARSAKQRPIIELDMGALDQIRIAAASTRESLLTNEEKQDDEETKVPSSSLVDESTSEPLAEENSLIGDDDQPALSAAERFLLAALLNQQPYGGYLKEHHLMASILVDEINDKLFDYLGDTAIEFNQDDQPEIIEDYEADIRELLEED